MKAKLDFIAAHAAQHAIRLMCRVLSVSPSRFHAWRAAGPKRAARQAARDALAARIQTIFAQSKGRYGAPRIRDPIANAPCAFRWAPVHAELLAQGRRIARKTPEDAGRRWPRS